MRRSTLLVIPSLAFVCACSDPNVPNGQVYFLSGEEKSLFEGAGNFRVDRLDTNAKTSKLFKGDELPETVDMGPSGIYRFRATGFDANGNAVVRGETLPEEVSILAGAQIPLLLARTDRMTLAPDLLDMAPGAYPKVGIVGSSALWIWANPATDNITTDGYNFAYWQQVAPLSSDADFRNIDCPSTPCVWKNLVIVGGFYAIAIADEWALYVDDYLGTQKEFKVPSALGSFSNVAGGTVLPGDNFSAVLIGGTRLGSPSAYTLLIDKALATSVTMLSVARAGAATLFETDVGLVVVGGSSDGAGVERIPTGGTNFTALNFPADPVTGATLVKQDAIHVLRVGGKNPDGTAATTVQFDVTCALAQCEAIPFSNLALDISAARSFYDNETGDSLIVGEDATGATVVYRYSPILGALTPIAIPADQQRVHSTAILLPNRLVALVGGTLPDSAESSRSIISVVSF